MLTTLKRAYENAKAKKLWTYEYHALSSDNVNGYWANNVEVWFLGAHEQTLRKNGILLQVPAMNKETLPELDL